MRHSALCKTQSKTIKKLFSLCQIYKHTIISNYISKKWTNIQEVSVQSTAPNTTRKISCKAWNFPVQYPSRQFNHGIKDCDGNMFKSIFKGNVQGLKYLGRCAFVESELLSFREPKRVIQNNNNSPNNPNNRHNYHDEVELYPGICKRKT